MPPRSAPTSAKPDKQSAKKTPNKNAATKTRTPRAASKKPVASVMPTGFISQDERMRFIAEAAYYKAERRGFSQGGELGDWIEAEAEIDARLDSRGAG